MPHFSQAKEIGLIYGQSVLVVRSIMAVILCSNMTSHLVFRVTTWAPRRRDVNSTYDERVEAPVALCRRKMRLLETVLASYRFNIGLE